MTRTADLPARELVSQIPREATSAGVDPQPETLRSRAARLYEAIDDGLIACLEIKKPHRRSIALDTRHHPLHRVRRSPPSGARLPDRCLAISGPVSRARVFYVSRARVGVCVGVRIWDGPRQPWNGTTV